MPGIHVAHTEFFPKAIMLADPPFNESGSNSKIGGGLPIRCPSLRFRRSFAPGRSHFGCNTRNARKSRAVIHRQPLYIGGQFEGSRS